MKRYLLFSGLHFDKSGGWGDFDSDYDHLSDAADAMWKDHLDWAHIVDATTGNVALRVMDFDEEH